MSKKFGIYCLILIILMTIANYYGIVYSNYLGSNNQQANKSANHFHK